MWFFGKKKKEEIITNTKTKKNSEIIVMNQVDSANDDILVKYADLILKGTPILINFEKLPLTEANKLVVFLSGVVYSIKGVVYQFKNKNFNIIFGDKDLYSDGSITELINKIERK